jgi:hypothetical protein
MTAPGQIPDTCDLGDVQIRLAARKYEAGAKRHFEKMLILVNLPGVYIDSLPSFFTFAVLRSCLMTHVFFHRSHFSWRL